MALSGSAAVAGAYLARQFGRNEETDGFLAAYGIYLVLSLVAQAFRLVVVPDLTRAANERRLGAETMAYAVSFCVVGVPASVACAVFAGTIGDAITGSLPHEAASLAGRSLAWLVPAAFLQLFASLAASALAARDRYGLAALGFGAGGVATVAVFVAFAPDHGLIALAWGLTAAGGVSLALPLAGLVADRAALGRLAPERGRLLAPLGRLLEGAALPVALQVLYVIGVRLAADLGVGRVSSLSYAYLIAAILVAATASSLSFASSAPLTRRGLDAESAAEHVVHASWISLAAIAAAAGVFALVGGELVAAALGDAYSGEVGAELGRLVVYLAPWMVAAVAFSVTFPLVFVMQRRRVLVPLALGAVALHVPVSLALREVFGLAGIALALALSTLVVIVVLLAALSPRALRKAAAGIGTVALLVSVVAALAFGAPSLFLGAAPSAALGLVGYVLLLALLRPRGLREAWGYVRALS